MDDYFNAIFDRFNQLKVIYNDNNQVLTLCLYSLLITIIKISITAIKVDNIKYYEEIAYNKFFSKFKGELKYIDTNNLVDLLTNFENISYNLLLEGGDTFRDFIENKIKNGDKTIYEIFNSNQKI